LANKKKATFYLKGEKGKNPIAIDYYTQYGCNYNNDYSELSFWNTTGFGVFYPF